MHNCHALIINGRLFGIFHTWAKARSVALMMEGLEKLDYSIEPRFIEGVGF